MAIPTQVVPAEHGFIKPDLASGVGGVAGESLVKLLTSHFNSSIASLHKIHKLNIIVYIYLCINVNFISQYNLN